MRAERYFGRDAHASSCTLGVMMPSGKRIGSHAGVRRTTDGIPLAWRRAFGWARSSGRYTGNVAGSEPWAITRKGTGGSGAMGCG